MHAFGAMFWAFSVFVSHCYLLTDCVGGSVGCCSKLQREVLCFEERVRQQDVLKDPVKQADLQHNGVMMTAARMWMMMMMMRND